ncbi:MAG: PAS domain-containing sensor histidine kinase [Mojavia pulchra JT2-VF2]|jgi:PAS domain S-box-containing protein|uniref:Circadian input-output histidine kinase CikA n=1 Tax=Mojavia pulchra JT2-VF2 TaxID=287848 RepID=A0A951Q6I5_9NOST|nr:PAS domain-containing sensor histidine kinase [Mojavia pulchra JT2-VF2]
MSYLPKVEALEGMMLTNADGTICACTPSAETILGYTVSQMQEWTSSNNPAKTIHPDRAPFPSKMHPAMVALQTGKPCLNVVMEFYKPSGELIWLRLNSQPLFRANEPSPYAVVTTFVDIVLDSSENKQLEELQHPEREFVTLVENLPDIIFRLDRDLRHIYISPKAQDESNISTQQFLGKTGRELQLPTDACDLFEAKCHEALATGQMTRVEYSIAGKRYLSRLIPERGVDGAVESLLGITEDITERQQVEEALRESEEKFRQLAENITEAVFWISDHRKSESQIIYVSPAYERIWGRSCSSLYVNFQEWLDAIHPEDQQRVKTLFVEQALAGRYDEEYRIFDADGKQRWIRDRGFPIGKQSGNPYRVVGLAQDITERKQAEEKLRQNEARFRGVVESDLIGIFFWNVEGQITDANDTFVQMLGYSRAQMQSGQLYCCEITPPEYQELDINQLAALQTLGSCAPYEKEFIRQDGSRIPILIGCTFLPGFNNQGVAFVLDISDRKRWEQEREAILVREQAARVQAEQANRIKDEFLGIISHELRNPLNPIIGWAELLQRGKLNQQSTAEGVKIIERNAKALMQLIEDLLDVSSILRGKISLNISSVNLKSTVQTVIETVRLAAEVKSIQLITDIDPDVGLVLGDATRLQQIVWNVLFNAIKFTTVGGKVLVRLSKVIETENLQEQHPAYAQIIVSDTGIGISPEFLPHIFEYFRQENSTTTRTFGGLGLGLAIVRNLVELHGGTIQAQSQGVEQGATFTVRLPLMTPDPKRIYQNQSSQAL